MARDHGRLFASLWDDDDFIATSIEAKAVFGFLVSQPDMAHDGVLVMRIPPWAEMLNTSPARLEQLLTELHEARFIVLDWRQMHVLVRSLIRRDKVYRQPNVFKSAVEHIYSVKSRPIRATLLSELERLDESEMNADTRKIRVEVMEWLRRGSGNPSPNPSGKSSPEPIRPDFRASEEAGESGHHAQERMSENRQSQEVGIAQVHDLFGAGQDADGKGSANPSAEGSTRARSTTPTPSLTKTQNPLTPPTASPSADDRPGLKSKRKSKPKPPAEPRPDVEALCSRLVELMVANGSDKPTVTDTWRTEARLLLDSDNREHGHRELHQAMWLLNWALTHHFWWNKIRSIPKFRKQYGLLRDQVLEERKRRPSTEATPPSAEIELHAGNNVVALRPNIPAQRESTTDRAVASGDTALAEFRRMTGRLA